LASYGIVNSPPSHGEHNKTQAMENKKKAAQYNLCG
jgi:hypothetical protein